MLHTPLIKILYPQEMQEQTRQWVDSRRSAEAWGDSGRSGAHQGGADETGAHQGGADETGAHQGGADETGAHQGGADETGAHQGGADETGALQGGAAETPGSDWDLEEPETQEAERAHIVSRTEAGSLGGHGRSGPQAAKMNQGTPWAMAGSGPQ